MFWYTQSTSNHGESAWARGEYGDKEWTSCRLLERSLNRISLVHNACYCNVCKLWVRESNIIKITSWKQVNLYIFLCMHRVEHHTFNHQHNILVWTLLIIVTFQYIAIKPNNMHCDHFTFIKSRGRPALLQCPR